MKINSFDLDLSSARTHQKSYTEETTRQFSFANIMDTLPASRAGAQIQDPLIQQKEGAVFGSWVRFSIFQGQEVVSPTDQFRNELENMRQIMSAFMKALEEMTVNGCGCRLAQVHEIYVMPMSQQFTAWEFTETSATHYEESEHTQVSAGGTVKTADNKEIDFSFDLSMERSFLRDEYFTQTQTGYALVDPIVIQSDMAAPTLSGSRFSFDLDLDGKTEDLPLPNPGTGFLSLDLNGDGQINDGSELFGPSTNDGFGELAAYDLDNNDWIDENDPVFDRLTLWEQGESGGLELTRIKDAGIGAIYLSGIASPFDLRSDDNDLLARVSTTSIALTEAGEVLPVQEMDYKV